MLVPRSGSPPTLAEASRCRSDGGWLGRIARRWPHRRGAADRIFCSAQVVEQRRVVPLADAGRETHTLNWCSQTRRDSDRLRCGGWPGRGTPRPDITADFRYLLHPHQVAGIGSGGRAPMASKSLARIDTAGRSRRTISPCCFCGNATPAAARGRCCTAASLT